MSAESEKPTPSGGKQSTLKLIIQQCLKASLKIVAEENETEQLLEIGRGIVVYLCFSAGATEQAVDKAVKLVLSAKLSEPSEDGSEGGQLKSKTKGRVSIVDLPGDILVVPQATLGGRFNKGNQPQYHSNCEVTIGRQLYDRFVTALSEPIAAKAHRVEAGRYGARQPLSMETDGPYSHYIEI